jgi:hypothetical protein
MTNRGKRAMGYRRRAMGKNYKTFFATEVTEERNWCKKATLLDTGFRRYDCKKILMTLNKPLSFSVISVSSVANVSSHHYFFPAAF